MAELGELCLWAAVPLVALAALTSIAGGWTGRGDLAAVGGRAAEAAAALLLLASAGLGYALLAVQLKYAYVADLSGFQLPGRWRLAALWSGPGGGALTLTVLIMAAAAVSHRLDRSRAAAARTGCLAALGAVGLLMVMVRAQPFAQLPAPAVAGTGLALSVKDAWWQLELWASYLATACAAFAFAGIVGEQLVDSPGTQRAERAAASLTAGLLTVAVVAATWRAYGSTGWLLDVTGASSVGAPGAAWLVAMSHLHAPGGFAVPAWAARWRKILGVALFPAALGAGASLLAAAGAVPPAVLWAGGLGVGIIAGAMAGLGGREWRAEGLKGAPGFGPAAFLGGLLLLALAGLAAVWALLGGPVWTRAAWPVVLLTLAGLAAWPLFRPAGRWTRVWPVALALALVVGPGAYLLTGQGSPVFALAAGLAAAALVGCTADLTRWAAARRRSHGSTSGGRSGAEAVFRARGRRRWASAFAHLGIALVVVGLAAGALTEVETRPLAPGDTLSLSSGSGGVRVTYLGLSTYQVGDLDHRIASFFLYRGDRARTLVTASMTYDWVSRRQSRRPAVERGLLRDIAVAIANRGEAETIWCRLAIRPLASLVWLGLGTLLLSLIGGGRPD